MAGILKPFKNVSGRVSEGRSSMNTNVIPAITHPLGSAWRAPNRADILVDDDHAIMEEKDFNELMEYSSSFPSGVYPGKMWKCKRNDEWFLRWYGDHPDPNMCSNHQRKILITE